jgi:hypothetical protein
MPATEVVAETLVVSRDKDPKSFRLPPGIDIPDEAKRKKIESYKTGGLNFYGSEAEFLGPFQRQPYFKFSISMEDALKLPEEVTSKFNFPPSKDHPSGIINE